MDIDGDDTGTFGVPQFTEGDIMHLEGSGDEIDADGDIDIDEDSTEPSSATRHTPVQGSSSHDYPARLNLASMSASKGTVGIAERAVLPAQTTPTSPTPQPSSSSPVCRICLDPYEEPTVSTGCWHTCCRECWLRCLGTTKLCPICKRITVPGDLRRIYL